MPPKNLTLPCPACGERDAAFFLSLSKLGEEDQGIQCGDCETEFSTQSMRDLIADLNRKWGPVLDWIEGCPRPDSNT